MRTIKVDLGKRSYPVVVGSDLAPNLSSRLKKLVGEGRLFVVYDAQVYALHGKNLDRALNKAADVISLVIPGGERSKSVSQLNRIQDYLLSQKISRSDLVAAVGGGVTSDLVGFAAATTLRGINWVAIPTTLLGMVDAAIGGKTGINHRQGKNLVGAFWQPRLVWCDCNYLMTLPGRELVSGLGEIVKYAALTGGTLTRELEKYVSDGNAYNVGVLKKLVEPCVIYKARVVARDELDTGERMVLNLGHTFGHAIEVGAGYGRFRHGEALILGLKAALHLSAIHFPTGERQLCEFGNLIESMRDFVPRRKIDLTRLKEALLIDKKRAKRGLNFILLQKPGRPIITGDVKPRDIEASLRQALNGFELVGRFNG